MLAVAYQKIVPRHYRRHLVDPVTGRTLCGLDVQALAHLPSLLDPSGFLAIGVDAESCRTCSVRANIEEERHRVHAHSGGWPSELARPTA